MAATLTTTTYTLPLLLLLFVISSSSFGFQIVSQNGSSNTRVTCLAVQRAASRLHDSVCSGTDRRQAILTIATTVSTLGLLGSVANAEMLPLPAASTDLPAGLLETRVQDNVMSPPQYGMESTDIFYPSYVKPELMPIEHSHLFSVYSHKYFEAGWQVLGRLFPNARMFKHPAALPCSVAIGPTKLLSPSEEPARL